MWMQKLNLKMEVLNNKKFWRKDVMMWDERFEIRGCEDVNRESWICEFVNLWSHKVDDELEMFPPCHPERSRRKGGQRKISEFCRREIAEVWSRGVVKSAAYLALEEATKNGPIGVWL